MAGILANSASETMTAGDTAVDNTRAGYVVGEQVTLSTTPTGTTYSWGIAKPEGATSRSNLSDTTSASVTFIPDHAGTWTITCVVDGSTTYVLRITATAVAITSVANAHAFSPTANNSIPAPALGVTLFCSSDANNQLRAKTPDGAVQTLDAVSSRAGTFTLVAGTATVANTSVTANTAVVESCIVQPASRGHLRYVFTTGVGFTVTSSAGGSDTSTFRYVLIG
jgi:hypothetical protein